MTDRDFTKEIERHKRVQAMKDKFLDVVQVGDLYSEILEAMNLAMGRILWEAFAKRKASKNKDIVSNDI